MQTAHQIVAAFVAEHAIEMPAFWEWFRDCGYPEEEANIHDSRFFAHLVDYVDERNFSPAG
jgi:hypothetical protein